MQQMQQTHTFWAHIGLYDGTRSSHAQAEIVAATKLRNKDIMMHHQQSIAEHHRQQGQTRRRLCIAI